MANAGSSAPGQRPAAAGERAAPQQQLQERNFQTQQRKAHPNQAAGTAVAKPQPAQSQARGFADDEPAPKRRLSAGRIASVLVLAILTGAGIAAAVKRDQVAELLANLVPAASKSDPSLAAAPFTTAGTSSIDSIDGTFQRTAIWRHIKVEFPEWYAERVNEAAKLTAEKRGDTVIAKHLAEAVVSLRRKHADQALTASPERLRFVASAFLDNLQALAKQNVETCYGFISQGETYPAVLEMLQKQGANEPLQKQVIAVFEAISDGRKSPQSYLPPRKSDYDALAAELTARGWSQADLQTFSDPRALGRASPQQVCKMVQDWFAAQIAIKDPAAQLRLLVESLRPVVAG